MDGNIGAETPLRQLPTRKQLRENWSEWVKPHAEKYLRDLGFTELDSEYAQHKVLNRRAHNKQRTRSQTQQHQLQRKQQR